MLHISHLDKSFGGQDILSDVTFAVAPGEKVALVGRNGCGKTTLLHIICGVEPYDNGTVVLGPSCEIGYLGQEGQLEPEHTLYQEMMTVFADVKLLEQQLRQIEEQMSSCPDEEQLNSLMNRYGRLQARFEHSEPYLIDAKISTVLHGMGFCDGDLDRKCREFSGGWQMRGSMARLLLREPDLLLLDEPTNHLDLGAVEWLEEYVKKSSSTIVLVSHDRYFLDRVINRTLEIHECKLDDYAGNYSYFLEERERRRELQMAAYLNQQKKIEHDNQFVERFRYKSTLATRVQSRIKLMEKRQLINAPDADKRSLKAVFENATASGREVLTVKNLQKAYGEKKVLTGLNLEVTRGERVALVGANGVGKSTLLRMLANLEKPDGGTIRSGFKLAPVYYAQHQAEALDMSRTVLEEVSSVCGNHVDNTRVRTILGCLLFEGDEVNKVISVLSGGERSRVALARCILTPSNLLLLDEPTNHLDIASREALLDALADYEGTVLLVTHDRHFMNELATCVTEIRDGQSFRYLGNYEDYHRKRQAEIRTEEQKKQAAQKKTELSKTQKEKVKKAQAQVRAAEAGGRGRPIRWKLEALEKRIFELEEELAALSEQLADPTLYADAAKAQKLRDDYEKKQAEAAELTEIWDGMA